MKLIVNPHTTKIEKTLVNEKEINITKVEFEFNDIPNDYVKKAFFTLNGETYAQLIENNECDIPQEVLKEKGQVELGVIAYELDNDEYVARFNPSPSYFPTMVGSLKDSYKNSEPVTPTDKEQMEQILNDGISRINALIADLTQKVESGYFDGADGKDGIDGKDALINGYNVLEIIAGDNVKIEQTGNQLIISAEGVAPLPNNHLETKDGDIFMTSDNAYFIVKESD